MTPEEARAELREFMRARVAPTADDLLDEMREALLVALGGIWKPRGTVATAVERSMWVVPDE